MPWSLRSLDPGKCMTCENKATHELLNPQGWLTGKFCWRCAQKAVQNENRIELEARRRNDLEYCLDIECPGLKPGVGVCQRCQFFPCKARDEQVEEGAKLVR